MPKPLMRVADVLHMTLEVRDGLVYGEGQVDYPLGDSRMRLQSTVISGWISDSGEDMGVLIKVGAGDGFGIAVLCRSVAPMLLWVVKLAAYKKGGESLFEQPGVTDDEGFVKTVEQEGAPVGLWALVNREWVMVPETPALDAEG